MDYFNNFQEALDKSPKVSNDVTIIAFTGNALEWEWPDVYNYSQGIGTKKITNAVFKDRKSESDRRTKASVTIYKDGTSAVTTNGLYRNNRGLYFKTGGETYYIVKEPVPDCMK